MQCPQCRSEHDNSHKYCKICKATYTREYRKTHPRSESERFKSNARSYAKVYLKRGRIRKEPCEICKTTERIEMHHEDYSQPLQLRWLCHEHHRLVTACLLSLLPRLGPTIVTIAPNGWKQYLTKFVKNVKREFPATRSRSAK